MILEWTLQIFVNDFREIKGHNPSLLNLLQSFEYGQ